MTLVVNLGKRVHLCVDQTERFAAAREETPAIVERLRAYKKVYGSRPPVPENPEGSQALIGMMAGNERFSRIMDDIIAGRSLRYGFEG